MQEFIETEQLNKTTLGSSILQRKQAHAKNIKLLYNQQIADSKTTYIFVSFCKIVHKLNKLSYAKAISVHFFCICVSRLVSETFRGKTESLRRLANYSLLLGSVWLSTAWITCMKSTAIKY